MKKTNRTKKETIPIKEINKTINVHLPNWFAISLNWAFKLNKPGLDAAWAENDDHSSVGFTPSVCAAVVHFVEWLLLILRIHAQFRQGPFDD